MLTTTTTFALASHNVKEFETRWIGWAGVNVPDEIGQKTLRKALAEKVVEMKGVYLYFLMKKLFINTIMDIFDAYKRVNQMFSDVVNEHYVEGDVVWCHDYRNMKVGWFLHTPFPSSEIHRTLPSRTVLLRSVVAADLVGFHTYDYARHFASACTRIAGLEGTPEGIEDHGKLTRVAAFPMGIDSDRFIRALELPLVQEHMKELKERFAARKEVIDFSPSSFPSNGVDRFDMIKGPPQKVLAFEKFLEENPHRRDKVVLLQIAVPTRTDVTEYQKLTSQVHEIVGLINGRLGTLTDVPIHHLVRLHLIIFIFATLI
ncbi:alpha,alpha-trehalose-phosphate synthase [UDP-forming] 1-like [Hibiscus syriacus]|uniref:alpha,alpha-trehalose-phosphate synthase [UDP-forming] 1-like n=1 Tax=Hibiscus syriacus TaxID=106335 RepID=UPI001921E999|nr:alpha,alpha-trehalose-phosphate synthase [UDP-forming] 1-like [Hibiscus syriacus]